MQRTSCRFVSSCRPIVTQASGDTQRSRAASSIPVMLTKHLVRHQQSVTIAFSSRHRVA